MFEISKEQTGESSVIVSLTGDVSVVNTEQMQQILLAALNDYQQVQINGRQITNIDIYALQLLCSAHRTAIAWNKLLTWNGTLPEMLGSTIRETGFTRKHGCTLCPDGVLCMWCC